MNERLQNAVAVVFALCSVTATTAWVWSRVTGREGADTIAVRAVEHPSEYMRGGQHEGVSAKGVEMVFFGDYQCPGCKKLQAALDTILARNDSSLRVTYHHFPLMNIHAYAYQAALASNCADRYGSFAKMHRALYASQDSLGVLPWSSLALRAGVRDTTAFAACVRDSLPKQAIKSDGDLGHRLALIATPTFLIGDSLYTGSRTVAQLESIVNAAKGTAKPQGH